jgi:hypothetical protein
MNFSFMPETSSMLEIIGEVSGRESTLENRVDCTREKTFSGGNTHAGGSLARKRNSGA